MSNVVERNVVEMQFDNSNFEKNVKESMSTIDKLKQALKFEESKEALTTFAKQLDNLDFSGLTDSIETIKNRFSNLGIVGATVVSRITNEMISGVAKITNSISGMISQGGMARAMNIEKAKFQLEGLGVTWDRIYDDINYGVKDTAYGLDAAARVAAQLVTSGISIGENMRESLRAISGVASMTGSSYDEIGQIFTTVAGQGKLMTMQLRQLELRGLNAAGELAKAMGTTEASVREMVTKGQIDFKTFSEAMDKAFGEHAKDSNKTLEGTLSNIRSAWARVGADFYQPIIRNEGELVSFLNAYREKVNDLKKELEPVAKITTEVINNILKSGARVVENIDIKPIVEKASYAFTTLLDSLKILWPRLAYFGRQIKNMFREFFPKKETKDFKARIDKIAGYIKTFNFNSKTIEKVKDIFRGLFAVVSSGVKIFKNLVIVVKPLFKYIADEASKMLDIAALIGSLLSKIFGGTVELKDFESAIDSLTSNIQLSIQKIKDGFSELLGVFLDDEKGAKDAIDAIVNIVTGGVETILTVIEGITGLDLSKIKDGFLEFSRDLNYNLRSLYDLYNEAGGGAKGFSAVITKIFKDISSKITEFVQETTGIDLSEFKTKVSTWLDNTSKKIEEFVEKAKKPIETLTNIFNFLKERIIELEDTLHTLGQKASIGLGKMLESPLASFAVLRGLSPLIDTIKQLVRGDVANLPSILRETKDALSGFMSSFNGRIIMQTAISLLAFSYAISVFAGSIEKLSNVPDFAKTIGSFSELFIAMGAFVGGLVWILKTLQSSDINKASGDQIFRTFDTLKKSVSLSMGNIIATTVMIVAIAKAIEIMADAIVDIASLDAGIENHLEAIGSMVGMLVMLWESLKKLSSLKAAEGVTGKFFITYAATLVIIAEAVKLMSQAFVNIQGEMKNINDLNGLMNALGAMAGVVGLLAALVMSLNKIKIVNIQNLFSVGFGVIAVSKAVGILADAIVKLKDVDAENTLKGLISVMALLWEVFIIAGRIAGKAIGIKTSISFLAMAAAIAILIRQINVLIKTPFSAIVKGLSAIVGILFTFVTAAKFFQNELASLKTAGFAMLEFAASLWIVSKAIENLKSLNPTQVGQGLVALLGSLTIMAVLMQQLGKSQLGNAGLQLLEVSAALYIISQAIKVLGAMDIFNILKGAGSLIIFLELLCVTVTKFTMATEGAVALLAVAGALAVLAIAIAIIAPLGAVAIAVAGGLLVFITILGVVAALASVVSAAIYAGAITISMALIIIAIGLLAVTAPIGLFAIALAGISASAHQAAEGIKVFVDTLIELTATAAANFEGMSRLAMIMLEASSALGICALSLAGMGLALIVFGAGAVVAGAGAAVLAGGLALLAGAIDMLVIALQAANLGSFANDLGLNFGSNISKGAADGVKKGIPLLTAAVSYMLNKSVGTFNKEAGIESPSKVFMESGKYIDMGLAQGITDNTDIVTNASTMLGQNTSKAINTELIKGTNEGSKQLESSMKIFSDITGKGSESAGVNVGVGFAKGLSAMGPKIKQLAANLAKSAMASMRSYLKIKSPSRVAMEIGEYTGEGFAIGMGNTTTNVEDSAEDLGKTAEQSLTTALSAAYSNLTSDVTDPTIKPVLDLSEIQNGASSIDSMLSRDYASNIAASYKSDRQLANEERSNNESLMSGLNDRLISAIMSNDMSNLPINLNVQLVGDAEGIFRLVQSENQRMTNMYGSSPLLRG